MKTFRLSLIAVLLLPMPALSDDIAAEAQSSAAPKTPAIKTITNFTQSLRCMDELFYAYGKQGIAITSTGIPDETGKVKTGTKEMLITAVSKMTVKSNAFHFIDFHSGADDLGALFAARGDQSRMMPDYYIRGSITQMDDNSVRKNKGIGFSLPFLDFGVSKDDAYDLLSMDLSIGDAATRKIIPITSTSNTLVLMKGGTAGEGGGKIGKVGLSFNVDISRNEGVGAATRTLVELGLIEALGKFTQVPYWKCLDTDLTNPLIREQAREWYDNAKENDRVLFIQRKLAGMGRYDGPLNGVQGAALKTSIAEYQSSVGLIADGVINFDLYASLLDNLQNQIAALPALGAPKSNYVPGVSSPVRPPAASQVVAAPAAGPAGAPNPIFRMKLDTDRGGRPAYKVGEFLSLTLSMNTQGTAYCYYQDASSITARIFPNQFRSDSMVPAGAGVKIPSGGFRIRFDKPGPERVACIGSDRELVVPSSLRGARDLSPLPVRSVDDIVGQYRQNNPSAVTSMVDITVSQ